MTRMSSRWQISSNYPFSTSVEETCEIQGLSRLAAILIQIKQAGRRTVRGAPPCRIWGDSFFIPIVRTEERLHLGFSSRTFSHSFTSRQWCIHAHRVCVIIEARCIIFGTQPPYYYGHSLPLWVFIVSENIGNSIFQAVSLFVEDKRDFVSLAKTIQINMFSLVYKLIFSRKVLYL